MKRATPTRLAFLSLLCCLCSAVLAGSAPPVATFGKAATLELENPAFADAERVYVRPGGPYVKANIVLPDAAFAIAVRNGRAFVAAGSRGLLVVDYGATRQRIRGRLDVGSAVHQVALHGDHALLGAADGLHYVAIDRPSRPRADSFYPTAEAVSELAVAGDLVALRLANNDIQLLDFSRPERPRLHATLQLRGPLHAIALGAGQLFVAADAARLSAWTITASGLEHSGTRRMTGEPLDLAVSGGLLLVAGQHNGLTVLDVSQPGTMQWLGSHQQLGNALSVAATEQRALVLNDRRQLLLVDVSTPAEPTVNGIQTLSVQPAAIALDGSGGALAASNLIEYVDFCCALPQISNEALDFGQGVNYGGERRAVIRDAILYVADWFSGIHLYDISNPEQPRLLSSLRTEGSSKGIIVQGDYAFVGDDDHGLQVINIRDPEKPFRVAQLPTAGLAYVPFIDPAQPKRLYLAGHRGGFQIIDISHPRRPRLLGEYDTPNKAWAIRVRDNIAWVADDDTGLLAFDVHDPAAIRLLGQFQPGGAAEDVVLDGDRAYVAFFDNGLFSVDISDPQQPRALGHVMTAGNARGIVQRGTTLFVADWLAGIEVIDVANATAPRIVSQFDTEGASWGLALQDDHAFVLDWWGGLVVLDVRDAGRLRRVGRYHHRDRIADIALRDNYAFTASNSAGLQLFDIQNPLNPTWYTGFDLPGQTRHVASAARYLYAAAADGLLSIVANDDPRRPRLLRQVRLPHAIDTLEADADTVIIGDRQRGLFLYHCGRRGKLKRRAHLATPVRLLAADGARAWFSDGHSLAVLDTRHPGQAPQRQDHDPAVPLTALASHGDTAATADARGRVLLLERVDDAILPRATLRPGRRIDALALDDRYLYIRSGLALTVYDIRDLQRPVLHSQQRLVVPVDGLHTHRGSLYLDGDSAIVATRTLPAIGVQQDGRRLSLALPDSLPLGYYDIVVERDNDHTVVHNAFAVQMPQFSKPSFTMEDLQRKLEQIRAAQEQQ